MRTAGVDLASQDKRTAMCVIQWTPSGGRVEQLHLGVGDQEIGALIDEVDKVGIDVPLGWPVAFADAVAQHSRSGRWPAEYDHRDSARYRLRLTDREVARIPGSHPPLSVSADRLAIPTMRVAALLSRLPLDVARDGSGVVVEVYPAAALRAWHFEKRPYKNKNADARAQLVSELLERTPWLEIAESDVELCRREDDALDAMVAAMVARAAATGLVVAPPKEEMATVLREGWIAVPHEGSLDDLVAGGSLGA